MRMSVYVMPGAVCMSCGRTDEGVVVVFGMMAVGVEVRICTSLPSMWIIGSC